MQSFLFLSTVFKKGCRSLIPRLRAHLPLTEGVQAGQHFGVLVAVQTYAADQELFVNLAYHRAGESGAFTGHPKSLGSLSLSHRTLPSETGLNVPARDPSEVGGGGVRGKQLKPLKACRLQRLQTNKL